MTYLLTWKGAYKNIDISRYIDKAAAKRVLDGIEDPSICGVEVDADIDLDYKKTELVLLYNGLAGPDDPQVVSFSSRADGQRRVFAQIEDMARSLPITDVAIPDASPPPPPEAQPSEQSEDTTDMAAKTKKTAKPRKAKTNGVKKVKAASNGGPKTASVPRENNVTSLITKMLERDRGASKKEIKAAALEKDPKYDEVKLDNTVRGILSVMSRNTPKFKKAKDDKRCLVYSIG